MTRHAPLAAALLLIALTASLAAQKADDLSAIPHFFKTSDTVWAGGQPTAEQLTALKQHGIKVVINLRVPTEGNGEGSREAATLKDLGVAYFNVPVIYAEPKTSDVDTFLKVTDEQLPNGPVFIHCTAGIRAGAFWMIRRVLRDGWDFDKALDEAHKIGLGNQQFLIDFAKQYIAGQKK